MCEKTEQICEGRGLPILHMRVFEPNPHFREEIDHPAAREFEWDARAVIVDGVAGYIACPDCMADERISDADLVSPDFDGDHSWAVENGYPANCNLCKDTGKLWVSV